MSEYICGTCGKKFSFRKPRKYCSIKCYHTHTPKIERVCPVCNKTYRVCPSDLSLNQRCSIECRNKSKDWRKKIGDSHRGPKSYLWKNGSTSARGKVMNTPEYKEWRLMVFGRDNYTCQRCGLRGVYLHAHHIKPYSKYPHLRMSVDNGSTLCRDCHNIVHTKLKHKDDVAAVVAPK